MNLFLLMLILLNPFAQTLYLSELIASLSFKEFLQVHLRASVLSLGAFVLFSLFGDFMLLKVFGVRLASLQIFGGLIILMVAFRFITVGSEANRMFSGNLVDLAPNIALPYMIGPGTIWLAILIGKENSPQLAFAIILGVLTINMIFLLIIHLIIGNLRRFRDSLLGKYFSILMRLTALFIGALGVEMILLGLKEALPFLSKLD
jgi:small neutral amino acid transporter SnatA (MarC family)